MNLETFSIAWFYFITVYYYQCFANTIPVITFQSNGTFSSETYLKRSGKLGEGDEGIKELTVCMRASVFYLRGRRSYFLSYANIDSADSLVAFIERKAFDQPYE